VVSIKKKEAREAVNILTMEGQYLGIRRRKRSPAVKGRAKVKKDKPNLGIT